MVMISLKISNALLRLSSIRRTQEIRRQWRSHRNVSSDNILARMEMPPIGGSTYYALRIKLTIL